LENVKPSRMTIGHLLSQNLLQIFKLFFSFLVAP
jgi:hypothetical protein